MRSAGHDPRDHGDGGRSEGDSRSRNNGNASQAPDARPQHESGERPASEPSYAMPVAERPAPEIKVDSEIKEDATPPRRGWWQR